jgi:hypothetical protein
MEISVSRWQGIPARSGEITAVESRRKALGLSSTELAQRGYPLDGEVANSAIVPEECFC